MKKLNLANVCTVVLIALTFSAGPASAVFMDGKVLNYAWLYPDKNSLYITPVNLTAGSGVDTVIIDSSNNVGYLNVSDTQINITFTSTSYFYGAEFSGIRLNDVNDTISPFGSVTIDPLTSLAGFGSTMISFDAENIWIDLQGLSFNQGDRVVLNAAPVPIPAAVWLFGAGLIGLVGLRRKFK